MSSRNIQELCHDGSSLFPFIIWQSDNASPQFKNLRATKMFQTKPSQKQKSRLNKTMTIFLYESSLNSSRVNYILTSFVVFEDRKTFENVFFFWIFRNHCLHAA